MEMELYVILQSVSCTSAEMIVCFAEPAEACNHEEQGACIERVCSVERLEPMKKEDGSSQQRG